MTGDPGTWHPSKFWTDSFPFTSNTAALIKEEQFHHTKL
jgi:hypothetical protein